MSRPEGFQLPLLVEFGGLPAENPTLLAQPPFEGLTIPQEGLSRFVRSVNEEVVIRTANDAANHLMRHVYTPFDQFDQEELWSLLMNTKNRVTHEVLIYRGTLNTVHIRLAEIFKEAVRVNAASLLLSHVHPSGDPTPSLEDVRLTELAMQAAGLLDIKLLDHIVVGENAWISLKERGLGSK